MESSDTPTIAVCAEEEDCIDSAESLANRLHLPCVPRGTGTFDLFLRVAPDTLALESCREKPRVQVVVDFVSGSAGYRITRAFESRQPLARALGYRRQDPYNVVDATAGLGRDAMLLATLGCRVTMLERSPVVCALLEDGLRRAANSNLLNRVLQERVSLHCTNALGWLTERRELGQRADAIYLDPMFPERTKSSLVRKEMRILKTLLGDERGSEALLRGALDCARERVVVKRPPGAPPLDAMPPDISYSGKRTRFDVYLVRGSVPATPGKEAGG
jgi:16S rRNA (guanine1516-N2)-methyltransferase